MPIFWTLKSDGLPSYLLEYCSSGKPLYFSWLLSNLSSEKFDELIKYISTDCITTAYIEDVKGRFGRNPVHALLLSGNKLITKQIVEKIKVVKKETD